MNLFRTPIEGGTSRLSFPPHTKTLGLDVTQLIDQNPMLGTLKSYKIKLKRIYYTDILKSLIRSFSYC